MLVSVLLSVYNGEKYLREAIDSVLTQTYTSRELLVVNDGSTDKTAEILGEYEKYITVIHQKNKGLGAGRNAGIAHAKGELYAFIDADDVWEKEKLRLQVDAIRSHSSYPLCFTFCQQFLCPTLSKEEAEKLVCPTEKQPGFIAGTLLMHKTHWENVGPFFEENRVGEFIDWYMRAQAVEIPHILLPEPLLKRRIHKTNMGRQKNAYDRSSYLKVLHENLTKRRTVS